MTKMNHIILYGNYEDAFCYLTDAQVGRIVRGLLHLLNTGEDFEPRGQERMIWGLLRDQYFRNLKKYEETCERNRNNAQKYWDSHKNVNDNATGTQPD